MKALSAAAALLLYILVNIYVILEVHSTLVQIYPTMRPIGATMRPIRPHQKPRADVMCGDAKRKRSNAK